MRHSLPAARVSRVTAAPDRQLSKVLRQATLAGVALVVAWPAARGYSQWIGWLPLWLVGMPAMAWWALHRFALPAVGPLRNAVGARWRRRPQARRVHRARRRPLSQAA